MVFDEAGTYTIEYTATDECGNTTNAERTVIVEEPPTYRTVLYTDGTFIINESSRDEAANVALHGEPTNVYDPFDPNGGTNLKKYIFSSASGRPWNNQRTSIKSVEIGSNISPTSTAYWFSNMINVESINLNNLDTSSVTNMASMFSGCIALATLDVSVLITSSVTDMSSMFNGCNALATIDLSGFNTALVTNMMTMFSNCIALTTIYASTDFIVTQVASSSSMFANMSTNLVGGAGTVWSSSYTDKTRAKIDGGVGDEGYFTAKN